MSSKSGATGSISIDLDKIFKRSHREILTHSKTRNLSGPALDHLAREFQQSAVASKFLDKLCATGCGKQDLLRLLCACSENPEPDRRVEIIGLDDRQLEAAIKSFRKCADLMDRINQQQVNVIFNEAGIGQPFRVPAMVRDYGALLEFAANLRWRSYWRAAKRGLIFYVKARSHQYHDKWVAELIATAAKIENYDEAAHSEWRRRNMGPGHSLEFDVVTSSGLTGHVAEQLLKTVFLMCEGALLKKMPLRNIRTSSHSASGC